MEILCKYVTFVNVFLLLTCRRNKSQHESSLFKFDDLFFSNSRHESSEVKIEVGRCLPISGKEKCANEHKWTGRDETKIQLFCVNHQDVNKFTPSDLRPRPPTSPFLAVLYTYICQDLKHLELSTPSDLIISKQKSVRLDDGGRKDL